MVNCNRREVYRTQLVVDDVPTFGEIDLNHLLATRRRRHESRYKHRNPEIHRSNSVVLRNITLL